MVEVDCMAAMSILEGETVFNDSLKNSNILSVE